MENGYILHIKEKLNRFGSVSFKKMFGGYLVYVDGLCIGVIADGELYFKANNDIIETYKQHDSEQFRYINPNTKKEIRMNWWKIVDEILEDDELLKLCYNSALKDAHAVKDKKMRKKKLKS